MSTIGAPKNESILPDNLDEIVRDAQNKVVNLGTEINSLEMKVANKTKELVDLNSKILEANNKFESVSHSLDEKQKEIDNKEKLVNEKDSALNVYANALREKEVKIAKYLAIFEGMKEVVSR